MADDFFGFIDPNVPRSLIPPAGYEAVHRAGQSWARQGDRAANTSWVSPGQWNHLIAQFRGLATIEGVDLSDVPGGSPMLLKTALERTIAVKALDRIVSGVDEGEGTANAVKVATEQQLTLDGGQLIYWKNSKTNTATAVTVEFNDSGLAYPVEGPDGEPPMIGSFLAGLNVIGIINGDRFVLLTDLPTTAQVAAAENFITQAQAILAEASTSLTQMESYYNAVTTALLTGQGLLYGPEPLDGATTVITLSEPVADRTDVNVIVGNGATLPPVTEFYDVDGDQLTLKKTYATGTMIFVRRANTTLGVGATGPAGRAVLASATDEAVRAFLKLDGWCRPEDFGAWTGDDETTILQAAIDDGRPILLKRNRRYVASGLRLRSNLRIIGDGTPTIKHKAASNDNLMGPAHVSGVLADVTWDNVIIEGVIFDGNKANQTMGTDTLQRLIRGKFTNFAFRRLKCINSVRGDIRLGDSRDGVIEFCSLLGGGKWGGGLYDGSAAQNIAISGSATRSITVRRNYIEGIGAEVFAAFPGYTTGVNNVCVIVENVSDGVTITENFITRCSNEMIQFIRYVGTFEPDLNYRPGRSVVSRNLLFGDNLSSFGANLGENAEAVDFIHNHVWGMKSHGVKVSGWSREILIGFNKIWDCGGNGITYVAGNDNDSGVAFGAAQIIGNVVSGCGVHGIAVLGNGSGDVLVGLILSLNICRNNGQSAAGSAGIRLACSMTFAAVTSNTCYDDQAVKTQALGLSIDPPAGGGGTLVANLVANNNLRGNATASAAVSNSIRSGFTYLGNHEGADPQLWAAKVAYDLDALQATDVTALASAYAQRVLTTGVKPLGKEGASAFGEPFISLSANGSHVPFLRVRNMSASARAVGEVFVYAA